MGRGPEELHGKAAPGKSEASTRRVARAACIARHRSQDARLNGALTGTVADWLDVSKG